MKRFLLILIARCFYTRTGSHSWQHINDVLDRASAIKGDKLNDCEYAAVLFHDCSLMRGNRETHAVDSANIAKKILRWFFSSGEVELITGAIRCHRASYNGVRTSWLGDLLSSADRSLPCVETIVKRSYQFALEHGAVGDFAIQHVVDHVKEKYGRQGYAFRNVPAPYVLFYGDRLKRMWSDIDDLDAAAVKRMLAL